MRRNRADKIKAKKARCVHIFFFFNNIDVFTFNQAGTETNFTQLFNNIAYNFSSSFFLSFFYGIANSTEHLDKSDTGKKQA